MDKITFTLSVNDVNVVLRALSKMPIEHGLAVFNYIRETAEQQVAAQQPADADGAGE